MNKKILKEQIIYLVEEDDYKPMRFKDIAYIFAINTSEDKETLSNVLNKLEADGVIFRKDKKYYPKSVSEKIEENVVTGNFRSSKGKFGFVEIPEDSMDDIFIPPKSTLGAAEGDEVVVKLLENENSDKRSSSEGEIIKILNRANKKVVGTFYKEKSFGFVVPDSSKIGQDIYIPKKEIRKTRDEDKVLVEIIEYPKNKKWVGRIDKVIGNINDDGVGVLSLIYDFGINHKFEKNVIKEADLLLSDHKSDYKSRVNLEDNIIFTIDGATAKDLDDAVSITYEDDVYTLGVHIADVSYYVKEGGYVDDEAYERGNSVYFPDRVIPMLPKTLSENLCSLSPDTEKRAFTCEMRIDKKGKILDYKFYKSLLKSRAKFVYDDVNKLYNEDKDLKEEYYKYSDELFLMRDLAKILRKHRDDNGSLDFDVAETEIITDKKGKPLDIKARERGEAEKIIEEFMLGANTSACEYFSFLEVNGIYRAHDKPDDEKMEEFSEFVSYLGYKLRLGGDYTAKKLQDFLNKIQGDDKEELIKNVLLRSMKKAVYTAENKPHFALGIKHYTHFTSPIRRYPDLMVHRIISRILENNIGSNSEEEKQKLESKAKHCSKTERVSEELERESDRLFMCEYMKDFVGNDYVAIIDGMNKNNIFVKLENTVEGSIKLSSLKDDYYEYNAEKHFVKGRKTKKEYHVGENLRVRLVRVDQTKREMEFNII